MSRPVIDDLTKGFILLAFLNFLVGASLGGLMAVRPDIWEEIGAIHGEINPYGWLTLLIYGMTYAVLSISAGLRPPLAWVGWLHLGTAELGVLSIISGYLFEVDRLLQIGFVLQTLAPLLFMINILSAVFSARRKGRTSISASKPEPNPEGIAALTFLGRSDIYRPTDRIAQRGTDMALMIFIAATLWMLIVVLTRGNGTQNVSAAPAATLLVYYGWIAGTVFSVWLHLFPRFFKLASVTGWFALLGQALWCAALFLAVIGLEWIPVLESVGNRLLGVMFIWTSVWYLGLSGKQRGSDTAKDLHLPVQSLAASYASWCFAFLLGVSLLIGLSPFSLAALHLLFLGWATTLIYGVGYSLFPLFLMRRVKNSGWALAQVVCSILGAVLMPAAFLLMEFAPQFSQTEKFGTLIAGGLLSTIGAIWFLLRWVLAFRESFEKSAV